LSIARTVVTTPISGLCTSQTEGGALI
jgi:hypothetical protein